LGITIKQPTMQTTDNKSPLPASIEMRALAHMEKGTEAIEALKLAFEEEENTLMFAAYGIDMKTGQIHRDAHKEFISEMCSRVYNKINSNL